MDPTTVPIMQMPDSHPMKGGDGANSYTQNSSYQRAIIEGAKGVIFQTIPEKLDINSPSFNSSNTFLIADFGCSTGPNTFLAVQNIIDAIMLKYQSINRINPKKTTPEFHVFFNDHVDNDFNTLFKTLPPLRPYFAAGVPGSFYCQLLPKASLHVAHSSFALHWLSKVPSKITNKGKIYCAGNDKGVTKAYFSQFTVDMDAFLNARAQELVEGGLLVIQMAAVPNGEVLPSKIRIGLTKELIGDSLVDMVNMGVITEEEMDSFNLPIYFPSTEEIEMVVEMNKFFTIEKICTLNHPFSSNLGPLDVQKTGPYVRAALENFLKGHFGSQNMDLLFHLFAQKLQKNQILYESTIREDTYLFALLKRKGNI